jgi:hypothetical protein
MQANHLRSRPACLGDSLLAANLIATTSENFVEMHVASRSTCRKIFVEFGSDVGTEKIVAHTAFKIPAGCARDSSYRLNGRYLSVRFAPILKSAQGRLEPFG